MRFSAKLKSLEGLAPREEGKSKTVGDGRRDRRLTMYALMPLKTAFPTEQLITHVTQKWMLLTMYALMCLQKTLMTE
jgi:hypothetical protein